MPRVETVTSRESLTWGAASGDLAGDHDEGDAACLGEFLEVGDGVAAGLEDLGQGAGHGGLLAGVAGAGEADDQAHAAERVAAVGAEAGEFLHGDGLARRCRASRRRGGWRE